MFVHLIRVLKEMKAKRDTKKKGKRIALTSQTFLMIDR